MSNAKKNTKPKTKIKLDKAEDMLASLPHILGFRPASSVVLIANAERGKEIGKRLRGDIPPPEHNELFAKQMIGSVTMDDPSSVLIAVIGSGDESDQWPPPHDDLVAELKRELGDRDVANPSALWVPQIVRGARWRCYDHKRCTGVLPDPKGTLAAAEVTHLGRVTYDSREELEGLVRSDDDLLVADRGALIDKKFSAMGEGGQPWSTQRGVDAVRAGLRAARSGVLALADDHIAELGIALTDGWIRDACFAASSHHDPEMAHAAARLWQALARTLPPPERAEAACLAGYAAYVDGEGALAAIALQAALEVDEGHPMAQLLQSALESGVHPEKIRGLGGHDRVGLFTPAEHAEAA